MRKAKPVTATITNTIIRTTLFTRKPLRNHRFYMLLTSNTSFESSVSSRPAKMKVSDRVDLHN